jgi:hypothetical protein
MTRAATAHTTVRIASPLVMTKLPLCCVTNRVWLLLQLRMRIRRLQLLQSLPTARTRNKPEGAEYTPPAATSVPVSSMDVDKPIAASSPVPPAPSSRPAAQSAPASALSAPTSSPSLAAAAAPKPSIDSNFWVLLLRTPPATLLRRLLLSMPTLYHKRHPTRPSI